MPKYPPMPTRTRFVEYTPVRSGGNSYKPRKVVSRKQRDGELKREEGLGQEPPPSYPKAQRNQEVEF